METNQPSELVERGNRPETRHTETAADIIQVMLTMRQACMMITGAIETYLGLERSKPPRRDR